MINKKVQGLKFLFIIVAAFMHFSCVEVGKKRVADANGNYAIQQRKADLLNGEYQAVCYSGYRAGQHPDRGEGAVNPTHEEILEDLKILSSKGFRLIRLYDSGENSQSVLELIDANDINIKVMLGIWLSAELCTYLSCEWLSEPIPDAVLANNKLVNRAEMERGIALANEYDRIVVAVNVGNEALVDWNDHKVDVDTMISYVQRVKKRVKQPVTVAENYEWWAAHGKKLAEELDFVSIHIYPIWEGRDIENGIHYSIENVQKVRNALPNSRIVISEAGWATTSSEFGDRAGEEKQKQYYNWLMEWSKQMNITTFFFSAFDEPWKGNPYDPYGAEKHWGLYFVDRTPKQVFQ